MTSATATGFDIGLTARRAWAALALVAAAGALAGCAETQLAAQAVKTVGNDAVDIPGYKGGVYKVGAPYQINGAWYYPSEDYAYDETGVASWYGPGFHSKLTATGEIYDQNDVTAAHRTLPMPSFVRVTNLDNGRSLVVRINDRGPYARGRIIDLSRRSAQLLGVEDKGTARVRVQIMAEESRQIAQALRGKGMVARDNASRTDKSTGTQVAVAAARPSSSSSSSASASAPPPVVADDVPPTPPAESPKVIQDGGRIIIASQPIPDPPEFSERPPPPERPERAPASPRATPAAAPPTPSKLPFGPAGVKPVPVRLTPGDPAGQIGQSAPKKTQIYIQIGAFSKPETVSALKAKLSGVGPIQVSPVTTAGGQTLQRVRIGPLASVDAGDRALDRVAAAGHPEAKLIVE